MAYVFREPTWNMEFTPYRPAATADYYLVGDAFVGQLYCMQRVSEVLGAQAMYCVFPKEVSFVIGPDRIPILPGPERFCYLLHEWNGLTFLWQVQQLVPRFAGFENEHWLALLAPIHADHYGDITDNITPPIPPIEEFDVVVADVGDGSCDACETLNATWDLDTVEEGIIKSAVFSWSCSPTGEAQWWCVHVPDEYVAVTVVGYPWEPGLTYASWRATSGEGWDGTFPATLELWSSNATCEWPETISIDEA